MITKFKLFEGKNIQNLYHIVDVEKMYYILKNNEITSYKFPNISTTRNKMMNGYLGDNPTSIFKLELDGQKLSDNYKIVSFQDHGWETNNQGEYRNKFYHVEWEEQIKTRKIKNASKYILRIILIKNRIENLKKNCSWFEKHFYSLNEKRNLPEILKDIISNFNIELWVQDGSIIKKDDDYVNSILNYKVRHVYHGYALYWRGYKKRLDHGYKEITLPQDKRNNDIKELVVGRTYNNIWIKNKINNVPDTMIKERPKSDNDISLNIFDFEYYETDIIKKEGDFILIEKGKLKHIEPIQSYDYSSEREFVLMKI